MDSGYMARALELAGEGLGLVSPNPLVGSVVVREGRIVGEGFHQFAMVDHAETHALRMAGSRARGATLYCNLEPCCHQGRTRPCTDALIEAGISRVVVAMSDPDPRVSGRGLDRLAAAGMDVEVGLMAAEAARLNEIYLKYTATGRPFIHLVSAAQPSGPQARGEGKLPQGLPAEWRPSESLRQLARRYDGLILGDTAAAYSALAADYIKFPRHRLPVIAGDAASIGHLRWAINTGGPLGVSFTVWPEPAGPESSSGRLSGGEPANADSGIAVGLGPLVAQLLSAHRLTSVIVLGNSIGLDASLEHVDKVTLIVAPGEVKDPECFDLPGRRGFRLHDVERQEANGFIELSGYRVPL
jgi:pyrimidine deaminase RibD-like protein